MAAINLEGLECNWRIKVTVSGELQQDFHLLFFNGTENGRRRILDLSIALWVIMVLLTPEQRKKKSFSSSQEYQFENCKNISPESPDKTRNFTAKISIVDT